MSVVPEGSSSIPAWMRTVANALNPLSRNWPRFTTPGVLGYDADARGAVTQATSKATGVTLNASCGDITLNAASLAANTTVSFVLTNSNIETNDLLVLNHASVGTFGAYALNGRCGSGSASIDVRNLTGGALAEAIVVRFALLKG